MDWQQVVSLGIVALAATLLWRGQQRARKTGGGMACGGCGSAGLSRSTDAIRFHARKDGQRRIILKCG